MGVRGVPKQLCMLEWEEEGEMRGISMLSELGQEKNYLVTL